MNLSIRNRITILYGIAVPALVFGLVFTAQHIEIGDLRTSLDARLEDRAGLVSRAIADPTDPDRPMRFDLLEQIAEPAGGVPLFVRIHVQDTGRTFSSGTVPPRLSRTIDGFLRDPVSETGVFHTVRVADVEALRTYVVPVKDPGSGMLIAVLETGESMASITHAQNRLLVLSLIEGMIGSLLLLAAGLVIFRRGLRPMDRILSHLRQVGDKDLANGLPDEVRPPEVQELADTLNTMWRKLDEAFKARDRLVGNVSHELRTPLSAMLGQTDVALMSSDLQPATRKMLEDMRTEIRRLVRLTNNLLRHAELENYFSVRQEPVNIRDLADEVAGDLWVLARGRSLSLSGAADASVLANRDLMKEMLVNLVDNAIKYTSEGGQVQISWQPNPSGVVLIVEDTGPGVPQELLGKIGHPFVKGPRPAGSRANGSGLGLSIVRQIVELHGGSLSVGNRPGGGAIATVQLPGTEGDHHVPAPQALDAPGSRLSLSSTG